MKITLIAVGNIQKQFEALISEYKKKISFFRELNIIEIKEINEENISLKKKKETEKILEKIPKNTKTFLCSLQGKQKTSEEFSDLLDEANICFVIGGSNGVEEEYFENKINFSKMTFPHQLFRVMLVEQIYRGLAIKNNIKYHK
ncbi:23S rRNA (pseudouridine(1915)-N(3))-methyltransferase RlmH [Mycoplasma procyoni]|uniref:23S rRNA (pseudouridine(1915)-N(3))-methyltransferase RlmH n=1 Tax=Mycoplasma procyoni TaxID=568784 RepID=UPI00197B34E9|nr:23S rRNA (pseudouridine(1915)-N(3))-methyltransferase RlmH [Mycoplasma procyoni]MBN3534802.1 23S rRNA (pseudouridine(1915)-N(3))-methyltransferase RlmH [Mycoplasma procyoni]